MKIPCTTSVWTLARISGLSLLAALLACGDGGPDSGADAGSGTLDMSVGDTGDRDAGDPDSGVPPMSRYVMMIRIRQPDGTTNATYLETRENLDPDQVVTTENAREFPQQLRFKRYRQSVFVEDVRAPTLTRFDYDPATGSMVEGRTITFLPRNLSSVRSQFFRADKAYALDGSGTTVAIFDPTEMVLRPGTIDISSAKPDGLDLDLLTVATRGNRTFLAMAFSDVANPAQPRIEPAIIVAVLDNENDRLLTVLRDERCGHASGMVVADSGDIYVHGDNGFNVIDMTKRSCIIRIPAGEERFDDYLWQPAEALGGRESSRLQPVDDTLAVTYALYPEQLDPMNPLSIVFDPVRRAWLVDLSEQSATPIEGMPFTRVGIPYEVDGAFWMGLTESFESTDIYALDPASSTATLVGRSEGQVFSVTRFP